MNSLKRNEGLDLKLDDVEVEAGCIFVDGEPVDINSLVKKLFVGKTVKITVAWKDTESIEIDTTE